jgi:dUTPase
MSNELESSALFDRLYQGLLAVAKTQSELNVIMTGDESWKDKALYVIDEDKDAFEEEGPHETKPPLDYTTAILDELVSELRPSAYNYKWWAKNSTELDKQNAKLELIDILHFHMSGSLVLEYKFKDRIDPSNVETLDPEYLASETTFVACLAAVDAMEANSTLGTDFDRSLVFRVNYKHAVASYARGEFNWEIFWSLVDAVGFTPMEIISGYLLKASLNLFRMQNGYKEGTYQKMWNVPMSDGNISTIEDNEVLLTYAESYAEHNDTPLTQDQILRFLRDVYSYNTP